LTSNIAGTNDLEGLRRAQEAAAALAALSIITGGDGGFLGWCCRRSALPAAAAIQ
jgi:hypothetical protein